MKTKPLGELKQGKVNGKNILAAWIFIIVGLLTVFFFIGAVFIVLGVGMLFAEDAKKSPYWQTVCPHCEHDILIRQEGAKIKPAFNCPVCKTRLFCNLDIGLLESFEKI